MKVVSIDPAPSKPAVVFDGKFSEVKAMELPEYCRALSETVPTLLLWDAPLTGPSSINTGVAEDGAYSQRVIERFFSRKATGYKCPKGISVLPYSGCPHWAISRACVGLPRVGRYDHEMERLPFRLLDHNSARTGVENLIVESHPAVAMWLWCRKVDGFPSDEGDWSYKGKTPSLTLNHYWDALKSIWLTLDIPRIVEVIGSIDCPESDDRLDAITGWVLGEMIAHDHPLALVLGTCATGAIALPYEDRLKSSFSEFSARELGES